MAGNNFRRVAPGQPLQIGADVWNTLLEVADSHKGNGVSGGAGYSNSILSPHIVRVRNKCGEDRERHEVLGIDKSTYTRVENEKQFDSMILLDCVKPDAPKHDGHFVVLLEPIKNNKVGLAAIAGPVTVRVTINNANDKWCDIRDDQYVLKTGTWGTARILWKETGTGTGKRAQVLLQAGGPVIVGATLSADLTSGGTANATLDSDTVSVKDAETLIPSGKKIASGGRVLINKNGANDWVMYGSRTCPT